MKAKAKPIDSIEFSALAVEAHDHLKTTHYSPPAKRSKGVMVKDAAPPGQIGKVFGFISASLPLGGALVPVPFGFLIDHGHAELVLVLAAALLLMWFYQRLTAHQERFTTITGKGYRPRQINLGAWTAPASALCLVYVALAVVLPFLMLLWTSLQPFYAVPSADSLARVSFGRHLQV